MTSSVETLDLVRPEDKLQRDRYGRPMVIPPGGGKPTPYFRCTKFIDCIEDKYKLEQWQQRMVAIGLADRPDLMLSVAAHRDDKDQLNHLCGQAKDAAKASAAATTGTAIHALCQQHDEGKPIPTIPQLYRGDLDAYIAATSEFTWHAIEQFMVLDELKIGGTPDRIGEYQGQRYIADIKTGATLHFGILEIAMQLAVYSRSQAYVIDSGTRVPIDVQQDWAIVIHLPAGKNTCELMWVDIAAGWEAVQVAGQVRSWRKRKNLATVFASAHSPMDDTQLVEAFAETDLPNAIATATTVEALTGLWTRHQSEWTPEHTELAKARKGILTGVTT